jgi:hypothetical protein
MTVCSEFRVFVYPAFKSKHTVRLPYCDKKRVEFYIQIVPILVLLRQENERKF